MSDAQNRHVDLLALCQDKRMKKMGPLSPGVLYRPGIFSPARKLTKVAGTPIGIFDQDQFHGVEGTSEAAPIWTGIAALIKKPLSNNLLYSLAKSKPDSFNDITSGSNGQCGFVCTAHTGYDYITGLGTPRDFVANVNAMN